jgi:hypothetical protein
VGDDRTEIERWVRERTEPEGRRGGFAYGESFQVITQGPRISPFFSSPGVYQTLQEEKNRVGGYLGCGVRFA